MLDEKGIVHQVKDPRDLNAIATLDRAIQSLKKAQMKTGTPNSWHERLTRVVAAQNSLPHDALYGAAPKDVKPSNAVLDFALTKKAALDLQHNDRVVRAREKKPCASIGPPPTPKKNLLFVPTGAARNAFLFLYL